MKTITVTRLAGPLAGAAWDDWIWKNNVPERLAHHMGDRPVFVPETAVKIGYDKTSVSVVFHVQDNFVMATARCHQERVCGDSCVEFFFAPGPDPDSGYFNLEINCGGTMLFHYHPLSTREPAVSSLSDCTAITVFHSLPHLVFPERTEPITWTVACSIPFALLEQHCHIDRPRPQTHWRANFYKCGDDTSNPHWLTWAPVSFPRPNFHLPRFFGTLQFQDTP